MLADSGSWELFLSSGYETPAWFTRIANPRFCSQRAGVQKPHSDPEALALSASTEGAGGAGSRAGSRWASLCSPLSYVHSTD